MKIRQVMHLNIGRGGQQGIGKIAEKIWPEQLRLCPDCIEEDRQRFGECYWHRLHQILGVEVCPVHACSLLQSKIPTSHNLRSYALFSAEQAIEDVEPMRSDVSEDFTFEQQLAIAQDIYWLLNQQVEAPGHKALVQRYHTILWKQGIATYRGAIRVNKLGEKFSSYYPAEFLRRLDCGLTGRSHLHWLRRLLLNMTIEHPLRHLLLIHFLGYTAETFFADSKETPPFGKGPWPCLNPACEHYHQTRIEHCAIIYSWSRKLREEVPRGTFICTCGFTYMRTGPDQSDEDRFHLTKIKAFGPIWEERLRKLWEDPSLTRKKVAQQLGVADGTVKLQAARLGLAIPRPGC